MCYRVSFCWSWAGTGIPAAVASALYDSANRITTWNGASLANDLNGNLASDGLTSYTWNARNQLIGVSGGVSASFAYDGVGQRRTRTTSGSTSYLYDGANATQELVGGSPTANVLSGGVDEVFQRTDGSGTRAVLTDALGSTVALVDGSGAVQTQYTYDPSARRRSRKPRARTRRSSLDGKTTAAICIFTVHVTEVSPLGSS